MTGFKSGGRMDPWEQENFNLRQNRSFFWRTRAQVGLSTFFSTPLGRLAIWIDSSVDREYVPFRARSMLDWEVRWPGSACALGLAAESFRPAGIIGYRNKSIRRQLSREGATDASHPALPTTHPSST